MVFDLAAPLRSMYPTDIFRQEKKAVWKSTVIASQETTGNNQREKTNQPDLLLHTMQPFATEG